jgi:hypothetical protein
MDATIRAGKEALEKYLWRGDHYLVYNDPTTGKTFDAFYTPQLDGQYFAHVSGAPASVAQGQRGEDPDGTAREGLQDQQIWNSAQLREPRWQHVDGLQQSLHGGEIRLYQSSGLLACHPFNLRGA